MVITMYENKELGWVHYYVYELIRDNELLGRLGYFEARQVSSEKRTYRVFQYSKVMNPVIEKFASSEGLAFDEKKILAWLDGKQMRASN